MGDFFVKTPLTRDNIRAFKAGDTVLITGVMFTARDAAHMRIQKMLDNNEPLPFSLENQIIYYTGPTPPAPGKVIGSAGPTTSYRMDDFTPRLIKEGVCATIGKGNRSKDVVDAMKKYGAVYLAALGGGAALLSQKIKSAQIVAFPELGAEAVRKLEVEDFPVIVAIDVNGTNLYERE